MGVVTPKLAMGASVLRREDQAFLKREGRGALRRGHGISHTGMPATPARICAAIRDAAPR
ncbi:MAG: hypothetical protein EOS58_15645 [Mesorhizobium sp.]|uniref:hypothetical protein n=1 Tax=unclassified Mesorhizobium TaxID=325217 RepID=UPI000F765A81|nr:MULTISPECIES: hypothetical protein [unclassified Mesorhizobium]RVD69122.1 hypothetical protein EN751_27680 [Mesorhizobium sp. M4A.F.Ca.ET.029.04.2.1]AZO48291.1 hypothetical protein EJ073_11035 [Mesorhizobium sp. M4B.F.Ca.ET.058.02.1.1]RUX47572.1 hypothetical protein EOA33_18060 [Mesorhizobium sp. M4A.F.Ca.ET.050.02.1.1]RVC44864.1 hypothetical protein EN781_12215 [Mesorhizobium sp. M4A.F.Ca.ET.090.04.2.1]RVC82983.1 hypothetical protein EN745_04840 [Mesorhizobium sp. M4A.F.Ca.ET.022.05.2.1]